MSSICLKVEPIAGTSVANAIFDCMSLSKRLRIEVSIEINGVYMFFSPDSTIEQKLQYYNTMVMNQTQPVEQQASTEDFTPAEEA